MRIPERNGDWKSFGSVAVTQFQRKVLKKQQTFLACRSRVWRCIASLRLRSLAHQFLFPENFQKLPLVVIVNTRKLYERAIAGPSFRNNFVYQIKTLPDARDLAWCWKNTDLNARNHLETRYSYKLEIIEFITNL